MSEQVNKFNFATVSDENSDLQSKQGGKFGLNTNCHFSLIDFTDKAGKDETEGNAVDLNIMVGDREFKRRVYDPEGSSLYNRNNEQVSPGEEGYNDLLNAALNQASAMVVHAVKAVGVTQDAINRAVTAAKPETFAAFAQVLISLLPADYKQKEVDVFLQYQWSISDGQTRTFLELPKNMKDKYWVAASTPGAEWKEVKDENGLHYVDDKNNKHKIEKSASFLESPKANQQGVDSPKPNAGVSGQGTDAGAGGKSTW